MNGLRSLIKPDIFQNFPDFCGGLRSSQKTGFDFYDNSLSK